MSFGERFWNEFNKSTIVSGILALAVWGAVIYLAIAGIDIPEVLGAGGGLILGYFFGARSGAQTERVQALNQLAKDVQRMEHARDSL